MASKRPKIERRRGLTLIELMVVVSILAVLTSFLIPRLRTINKDRGIREASRLVASTFSEASNRAIDEGVAGVLIERNPNFVDSNGVNYAGTTLFLMRRLSPFSGDNSNDRASYDGDLSVSIVCPGDHSDDHRVINVNDEIRLNFSSMRYRISEVFPPTSEQLIDGPNDTKIYVPPRLRLSLVPNNVKPSIPPGFYPFTIYRQPRKLASSRVDLPDGYFVDLRASATLVPPSVPPGSNNPNGAWELGSVFDAPTTEPVYFFFDSLGSVDRFYWTGGIDANVTPTQPFYFLVNYYSPTAQGTLQESIQSNDAMWVTLDNKTGSVNIAYNAPPANVVGVPFYNQLRAARGFGRLGQSANQ